MTPYIKSKYDYLKFLISSLAERQVEIRRMMLKSNDNTEKNKLNIERVDNTAALRIMHWLKWTLKGQSYECKRLKDPRYTQWMGRILGYHIHEELANLLNLREIDFRNQYTWYSEYRYFSARNIYWYIWNYLFPKSNGIFGLYTDDDIENDIWRTKLGELIKEEWMKFKEIESH